MHECCLNTIGACMIYNQTPTKTQNSELNLTAGKRNLKQKYNNGNLLTSQKTIRKNLSFTVEHNVHC